MAVEMMPEPILQWTRDRAAGAEQRSGADQGSHASACVVCWRAFPATHFGGSRKTSVAEVAVGNVAAAAAALGAAALAGAVASAVFAVALASALRFFFADFRLLARCRGERGGRGGGECRSVRYCTVHVGWL